MKYLNSTFGNRQHKLWNEWVADGYWLRKHEYRNGRGAVKHPIGSEKLTFQLPFNSAWCGGNWSHFAVIRRKWVPWKLHSIESNLSFCIERQTHVSDGSKFGGKKVKNNCKSEPQYLSDSLENLFRPSNTFSVSLAAGMANEKQHFLRCCYWCWWNTFVRVRSQRDAFAIRMSTCHAKECNIRAKIMNYFFRRPFVPSVASLISIVSSVFCVALSVWCCPGPVAPAILFFK